MPVRACTCHDLPALRWGRHGTPFTYGHGTGRTQQQAAELAARQGRAWAARRLVADRQRGRRADARRREPRFSDRIIQLYEGALHARLRLVQRLLFEYAGPAIRDLDLRRRADAVDDLARFYSVVRVVRDVVLAAADQDEEGLRYLGEEVDEDVTATVDQQVGRLFNIPLAAAAGSEEAVEAWVRQNVALIKSLQGTALDEIEEMVTRAMSEGQTTKSLARAIMDRFGVSWSRASLIARDQTAKLASRINQERQTAYGITQYQWSTSGDARVRQEHARLDGQIFRWSDPPVADRRGNRGHPGELWQCRCDAQPVLPGEDTAALIAAAAARKERELAIMQRGPTVQGLIPNRSGFSDWNRGRIEEIRRGVGASVGL